MSRVAYNEFLVFKDPLDQLRDDTDQTDVWIYQWNGGLYSARQYYRHQFRDTVPSPPFCWIWKGKCMPRIKFFAWLLLADRLNTRELLRRRHKHLEEGYACVMCPDQIDESTFHLFFECTSSISIWFAIGIQWDLQGDACETLVHQRENIVGPYFMDLFMIAA